MKLSGFSVLPVLSGGKRPQGECQSKFRPSVRFQADYEDERPEPSPKKMLWQELVKLMRYTGKRHPGFDDPGLKDKMKDLTRSVFKMLKGLGNDDQISVEAPPKIPQPVLDILKDLQTRAQTKPASPEELPKADAPTAFETDFATLIRELVETDPRFNDPALQAHLRDYCLNFRDMSMGHEGILGYLVPTPIHSTLLDIVNTALKTARPPQNRKLFSKNENNNRHLKDQCHMRGTMFLDRRVIDSHVNNPLYQSLSVNADFLKGLEVDRLAKQKQTEALWRGDVTLFTPMSIESAQEAVIRDAIRGAIGNIAHTLHYQMSDASLRKGSPLILTRQLDGRMMGQFEGQSDPPPFDMTDMVKDAIKSSIGGPALYGKTGEIFTEIFLAKLMNGEILGTYGLMRDPAKSTTDRLVLAQVPHVMGGNDTLYRKLYPKKEAGA